MEQTKKVPVTFAVELGQLQRLDDLATRTRLNRSAIMRDAIEQVLARHENGQKTKAVSDGRRMAVDGAGRRKKTTRRV